MRFTTFTPGALFVLMGTTMPGSEAIKMLAGTGQQQQQG